MITSILIVCSFLLACAQPVTQLWLLLAPVLVLSSRSSFRSTCMLVLIFGLQHDSIQLWYLGSTSLLLLTSIAVITIAMQRFQGKRTFILVLASMSLQAGYSWFYTGTIAMIPLVAQALLTLGLYWLLYSQFDAQETLYVA